MPPNWLEDLPSQRRVWPLLCLNRSTGLAFERCVKSVHRRDPGDRTHGAAEATPPLFTARTPAEMYGSVSLAMNLVLQIGEIDKEISSFRKSHHIDPSLKTLWDRLFPKSRILTPDQVTNLLTPAAMHMVPDSCPMKGYAAGCLSSCLHLCNFGGPDAACIAKCKSDYVGQLKMERDGVAQCFASQTAK